jgi:hypothetical protein
VHSAEKLKLRMMSVEDKIDVGLSKLKILIDAWAELISINKPYVQIKGASSETTQ